ncbi:MAG TPA: MerR family transcriptional regulator [Gammaproteobacteria bacterium]|nr:MerR family transcriptional regulator [Gammaproteobacteria bacterium]
MADHDEKWIAAGECAKRTGLTVRALRVYEREGLLNPARSGNGWRRYGPGDLARLNIIVILKSLGLTLAQIRQVLAAHPPSLLRILDVQAEAWKTKLAAAERAFALIEAARSRLQLNEELSLDELCDLIKSAETARSTDMRKNPAFVLRDLINELITPEEERAWSTWWAKHPEEVEKTKAFAEGQRDLFRKLQRLADRGADPASPEVQALVDMHNALLLQCGVYERTARLLEWNATVTAKWMGLRAEAEARSFPGIAGEGPHDGVSPRTVDFFHAAARASRWAQALREVIGSVKPLVDSGADPATPEADEAVLRLDEICREHSLGDAYVYARWAPFILQVNRLETPEGYEAGWDFLARALQARKETVFA